MSTRCVLSGRVRRAVTIKPLAILAALVLSLPAHAYEHYLAVPRTFTLDRARFAELLDSGHTGMLRIALFGDSQETSPGGAGPLYEPQLNWRLWQHYGNCGETMVISHIWSGSGAPPADWLWRGQTGGTWPLASSLDPSEVLPNIHLRAHRALGEKGQGYPWIAMLLPDGVLTGDPAVGGPMYFDTSGEVRAEFFAVTQPSSGAISWVAAPSIDPHPNFYVPPTSSGILDLELAQPVSEIRSGMTPPLDFAGKPYMQVRFWGTSLEDTTEIIGLRYVNLSNRTGAIMHSTSASGYWTRDFVLKNGNSGPMLRAFGFHAVMVHTGANDASHDRTAAAYQADLVELIAWIREAMDDPHFPVIVACDVDFTYLTSTQRAEFDQYPGAAWEVAKSDPDVLLLNLRRIMLEDHGWGEGNYRHLVDPAHLTQAAQKTLAASCVDALFAAVGSPCDGDLDGSGAVDGVDLGVLLGDWGGSGAASGADIDGDGVVGGADLGLLLAGWGECGG